MNEQQTNIEQRLIEHYEGKLEGEAYDEVKAWIASSEDNRQMARHIYSLLLAVDVHQVRKEIDTEKALKKVKGRKIYNPQIEMFARFKMKSSFHKTKRII